MQKISVTALIVSYCYGAKIAILTKWNFTEYATIMAANDLEEPDMTT